VWGAARLSETSGGGLNYRAGGEGMTIDEAGRLEGAPELSQGEGVASGGHTFQF